MLNQAAFFADDASIGIQDPYEANRLYYLRGNGTAGARPTIDDKGSTPLEYADATPSSTGVFSSSVNKWPGLYSTSMFMPNGAMRVAQTAGGAQNTAFRNAMYGYPFSMLMRVYIAGDFGDGSNKFIRQIAQNPSGGWGGSGIIVNLYHRPNGDGAFTRIDCQCSVVDGSTGNRGDLAAVTNVSMSAWHELLLTLDNTGTYRFYVDGTRQGLMTKTPVAATDVTTQGVSTGCDVVYSNRSSPFWLADDIFYNTCIQTGASYTPATQPYA